jgi:uncharacterized OB-fold protein
VPRIVVDAVRALGSLSVANDADTTRPAGRVGVGDGAERALAWDEDETTLAIEAARHLPATPAAVVGPGIDAEVLRVALDLPVAPVTASDPMAVAKGMRGPVWAVGCPPGTASAIAALVDDREGADVAAPRDVSPPPRAVSPLRALQESRRVPPAEPIPDSPMGAYVPWGTWMEDLPARLRLVAQRCKTCGRAQYPPRAACVQCRSRVFGGVELPREALVYAATRIGRGGAPSEFALEQAQTGDYWMGVVEWPEPGVRVTARLSGYAEEAPRIGDRVRPVVRRLFQQEGRTRYGTKFEPISY